MAFTSISIAEPATGHPGPIGRPQRRGGPLLGDIIDLRLLVIAAGEGDPHLMTITDLLTRLGTPFDVIIASGEGLKPERLWRESHAYYQGVILATGALRDEDWQNLRRYEERFGIRHAVFSTCDGIAGAGEGSFPGAAPDAAAAFPVTLTDAGRRVFWYLNQTQPLNLPAGWACPAEALDGSSIPLLVAPEGQVVAAIRRSPDGRETLAFHMRHGPDQTHSLLLGYGLVNWVTRGVFVGARRVYLSLQVDDIFAATRLWDTQRASGEDGRICRLSGRDVAALLARLDELRAQRPNAAKIELDLAYNGGEVTLFSRDALFSRDDTLVPALVKQQRRFRWINHTFSHQLLDDAGYETGLREIELNQAVARNLGLVRYCADCLVTPDTSGLDNGEFLRAAKDAGLRYLVSDTSRDRWSNPAFNEGIASTLQPDILVVPRHPTNLFYNVSTPEEWMAEYNWFYRSVWGRDLTYREIIDKESEMILAYLLRFDIDPLMFHQANLVSVRPSVSTPKREGRWKKEDLPSEDRHAGSHSLLSDLIEAVLEKYDSLIGDVPICCLSLHEIGDAMAARAAFTRAQVQASLVYGWGLVLGSDRDVIVPLTGIRAGEATEHYASQHLSSVALQAHRRRVIPMSAHIAGEPLTGYEPADGTDYVWRDQ